MMRRINVIDLDSTLLPYDSFGWLVKSELKKFDLFVWWFSVLRVLRLASSLEFKKAMTLHWLKKYDDDFLDNYANKLYNLNTENNHCNQFTSHFPIHQSEADWYFERPSKSLHLLPSRCLRTGWTKQRPRDFSISL